MAKLRYTGPDGVVRHNDKALTPGEFLEVPDHEVEGYLALGFFSLVETSAQTPNASAAAGDEKE